MKDFKPNNLLFAILAGIAGWVVPGAGHLIVGEYRRAVIIFTGIVLMFGLGLWIGSIGVLDPVQSSLWFVGQMLAGPVVWVLGRMNIEANGVFPYPSYGNPFEIGQIYTSMAGVLNFLCILSAFYMAYSRRIVPDGSEDA